MSNELTKTKRRVLVIVNYLFLIIMEISYYFVLTIADLTIFVDIAGISLVVLIAVTFVSVYKRTGIWALTHSKTELLDERQIELTHRALSLSYGWFTVICLTIMLIHASLFRLVPQFNFIITVPLVSGLIYFAHILPGSIIAWGDDIQ